MESGGGRDREAEEDALTRLVREGVRPEGPGERVDLSLRKLAGELPLGVDAPSKALRKTIGGGGELLALVKFGFLGVFLSGVGLLFVALGAIGGFEWTLVGVGAVSSAVGAASLRSAYQALRNLRAISRT